jgi:hypothetical protein
LYFVAKTFDRRADKIPETRFYTQLMTISLLYTFTTSTWITSLMQC